MELSPTLLGHQSAEKIIVGKPVGIGQSKDCCPVLGMKKAARTCATAKKRVKDRTFAIAAEIHMKRNSPLPYCLGKPREQKISDLWNIPIIIDWRSTILGF